MEHLSSAETAKRQDGSIVRELIEGAIEAQQMMGQEMDLADIWASDAFTSLSETAQKSLISWAKEKGYPVPEASAEEEEKEREATPATDKIESATSPAPLQPETRESREARGNRPKRIFEGYRLVHDDDGSLRMKEDFRVRDDRAGGYREGEIETSITLTKKLAAKIGSDENASKAVEQRCDDLRRALDRKGVKVFFDRPRDTDKLYPKWKYELEEGQPQQERILDVPPFIIEMVRTKRDYYDTEEYKAWYGPLMQRKRETIISEKLAAEHPDEADAQVNEPEAESKPAKPVNIMDARTMTPAQAHETLKASATMLAEKFEPLFKLPEQIEKYLSYVTDFARSTFKVSFGSDMTREESNRIVRAVLLEHFAKKPEMLAAIETHLPETPAAPAPAPAIVPAAEHGNDEYMEVPDEALFSDDTSADDEVAPDSAREANEAAAAQVEYKKLRNDIAQLDIAALDDYVGKLEKTISPDNRAASRAAQLVLAEIELGRVGEASERRLTNLRRSPDEQKLIDRHPELDARNIRIDENDQLVAFIDRQHVDEGVKRVMSRVIEAALGGTASASKDEALVDQIANYLMHMLLAKNENEATRRQFTQRLAAYHVTDSEVHFRNVESLVSTVAGLAEQLRSQSSQVGKN